MKKQNNWSVIKPLLLMCIAVVALIAILHGATNKPVKKEECTGSCRKINADVLNVINVKLM